MEPITPKDKLAPLLEEYKQLTTWVNNIAAASFKLPALIITGILAVGIAAKDLNQYYGIGVGLALFMILIFLGYCDSMVNGIGLRLIEIELRVNKYLGNDPLTNLTWHRDYIVHESKMLPGFDALGKILVIPFVLLLSAGMVQTWVTLRHLKWHLSYCIATVVFIVFLNAAAIVSIV